MDTEVRSFSMSLLKTDTVPISVFIITQDEEAHIAQVLESVKRMQEVIIVDSGSTDRTIEIAEQFGAKIYHHDWQGYAKQKQYAMSLCSNEWVLNLDGDEVLNESIVERFKQIVENDEADCVRFKRDDLFIGQRPSRWTKKPNNMRLYKQSKARFNPKDLVHECAKVGGKELSIGHTFDHYGYQTVTVLTDKNNQYSTLKAQQKNIKGKRYSSLKLGLVFPITFLKKYIFQGQIFSGKRGFIQSIIAAHYAFLKEAKLYELNVQKKR